jgi:hypothetical protein
MSDRKASISDGKAKGRTTMRFVLPHAYQSWSDDTELLFRSKDLHDYLTGAKKSSFEEDIPAFCWEL